MITLLKGVHCGRGLLFWSCDCLHTSPSFSLFLCFIPLLLLPPSHTFVGQQASRESLASSLSGDVSEAGLSSHQGALGAPVMPQPSGSPAAAAASVTATPSKVGHWQCQHNAYKDLEFKRILVLTSFGVSLWESLLARLLRMLQWHNVSDRQVDV